MRVSSEPRRVLAPVFGLCALFCLSVSGIVVADELQFSGILNSKVAGGMDSGEKPLFGFEEYANLRLQKRIKELATFYAAFNLAAASGLYAPGLGAGEALLEGENYTATVELERLYFRVSGEKADLDAGLMRLAFGYGQAFSPMDFLNPRNPAIQDARPRAVLGTAAALFPSDTIRLGAFLVSPAFNLDGSGLNAGVSLARHGDRVSVQGLYAYETPEDEHPYGIHRTGLSIKADVEVGLTADCLYTYVDGEIDGAEQLSAAGGIDYTFLDGDLYVLVEYLFNGTKGLTAGNLGFGKHHYLYASGVYHISDYTNLGLACMVSLEDSSFLPIVSFNHDLFQGMTLTLTGQVPLGLFSEGGQHGELGQGFLVTAKVALRL
jgi:hypothetical protein